MARAARVLRDDRSVDATVPAVNQHFLRAFRRVRGPCCAPASAGGFPRVASLQAGEKRSTGSISSGSIRVLGRPHPESVRISLRSWDGRTARGARGICGVCVLRRFCLGILCGSGAIRKTKLAAKSDRVAAPAGRRSARSRRRSQYPDRPRLRRSHVGILHAVQANAPYLQQAVRAVVARYRFRASQHGRQQGSARSGGSPRQRAALPVFPVPLGAAAQAMDRRCPAHFNEFFSLWPQAASPKTTRRWLWR